MRSVPEGLFLYNHRMCLMGLIGLLLTASISELRCHRAHFAVYYCIQEAPPDIHLCLPLLVMLWITPRLGNRGWKQNNNCTRSNIVQGRNTTSTSDYDQLVLLEDMCQIISAYLTSEERSFCLDFESLVVIIAECHQDVLSMDLCTCSRPQAELVRSLYRSLGGLTF